MASYDDSASSDILEGEEEPEQADTPNVNEVRVDNFGRCFVLARGGVEQHDERTTVKTTEGHRVGHRVAGPTVTFISNRFPATADFMHMRANINEPGNSYVYPSSDWSFEGSSHRFGVHRDQTEEVMQLFLRAGFEVDVVNRRWNT